MPRRDANGWRHGDDQPVQVAMGSRSFHGAANAPCAYCWPALIDATFHDAAGLPCCGNCGNHPDRRSLMPRFLQTSFRGDPTYAAAA